MATTSSSSSSSLPSPTAPASTVSKESIKAKAKISTFLDQLDSYQPTIPVEVTSYHLSKGGCNVVDSRIPKLVSLAADKFLAEVIYETKQTTELKNKHKRVRGDENALTTLSMDALCTTLKKKKISVNPNRLQLSGTLLAGEGSEEKQTEK